MVSFCYDHIYHCRDNKVGGTEGIKRNEASGTIRKEDPSRKQETH